MLIDNIKGFSLNETDGVEYQQVWTVGRFDNSQEILIGPRSFIDAKGESVGGGVISARDSKVGFLVITPFTLSDSGKRILINRGWIPRSRMDPETRKDSLVSEEMRLSGVLRLTEETSSLTPPNDVKSDRWQSRDIEALASKLNTLPVFLDLDLESSRESAVRGGPVGGQTRISLRNDHAQYMMTWWGLTAVTTLLWLKRFVL